MGKGFAATVNQDCHLERGVKYRFDALPVRLPVPAIDLDVIRCGIPSHGFHRVELPFFEHFFDDHAELMADARRNAHGYLFVPLDRRPGFAHVVQLLLQGIAIGEEILADPPSVGARQHREILLAQ